VKELGDPERLANLDLTIWGDNLHAPIIERIVELPMDIYAGALRITLSDVLLHALTWISFAQSYHLLALNGGIWCDTVSAGGNLIHSGAVFVAR